MKIAVLLALPAFLCGSDAFQPISARTSAARSLSTELYLSPSSRYLRNAGSSPEGDLNKGNSGDSETPEPTVETSPAIPEAASPEVASPEAASPEVESPKAAASADASSASSAPTSVATADPTEGITYMEPVTLDLDDDEASQIAEIERRLAALEGPGGAKGLSLEERLRALEAGAGLPSPVAAIKLNDMTPPTTIQGRTRKTMAFSLPVVERVQFTLFSAGRPVDALIEHWQGPDHAPMKMQVYSDDGNQRPVTSVIPVQGGPSTVQIVNLGSTECPVQGSVQGISADNGFVGDFTQDLHAPDTVQGGALKSYPVHSMVETVQLVLKTDGRPLTARIEVLQGPSNVKQVVEVYSENGAERPFFAVIETPGKANTVRVVNTAQVEFPISAWVEPYRYGRDDGTRPGGDADIYTAYGWDANPY